jgi:hypothetical protein
MVNLLLGRYIRLHEGKGPQRGVIHAMGDALVLQLCKEGRPHDLAGNKDDDEHNDDAGQNPHGAAEHREDHERHVWGEVTQQIEAEQTGDQDDTPADLLLTLADHGNLLYRQAPQLVQEAKAHGVVLLTLS